MVLIEQGVGQSDRGRAEEHLAVVGRVAVVVEDQEVDPEGRRGKGAGRRRLQQGAGDVAAADLGAAAVLDDRPVARQGHQEQVVLDVGRLASGTEAADGAPVEPGHAAGALPAAHQAGHHAEHRDPRVLDELAELAAGGRTVEQGDRRAVDQRGVDQPRPHHPADAGGPGRDVAGADVLMQVAVNRTLDRRRVGPGDRLGLAGGAG